MFFTIISIISCKLISSFVLCETFYTLFHYDIYYSLTAAHKIDLGRFISTTEVKTRSPLAVVNSPWDITLSALLLLHTRNI